MTEFLLVRHATAAHVGRSLAGRAPGVHLGPEGLAQARALAGHLGGARLDAVFTSPLERCVETAAAIAAAHGLAPVVDAAFTEVDFGAWTGLSFDALDVREDWRAWNASRGSTRAPGGESMAEVVRRAVGGLERIAAGREGGRVVVVSHCDVIRPVLARYLGLPLDNLLRFDVDPASVSVLRLAPWGGVVGRINCRVAGPDGARSQADP